MSMGRYVGEKFSFFCLTNEEMSLGFHLQKKGQKQSDSIHLSPAITKNSPKKIKAVTKNEGRRG